MSVVVEELLQHVQHAGHLSEDQHPVAARFQLPQQRVESLQLTCAWGQMERTRSERPGQTADCFWARLQKTFSHFSSEMRLTTVVLYEPQVRELGPHVALDAVEAASQWGDLGGQRGGEVGLLLAQRGRRVGGVHGDGRSLHRGDRKCKPKKKKKKN